MVALGKNPKYYQYYQTFISKFSLWQKGLVHFKKVTLVFAEDNVLCVAKPSKETISQPEQCAWFESYTLNTKFRISNTNYKPWH